MWVWAPIHTVRAGLFFHDHHILAMDAHAYWLTAHQNHLYASAPGTVDAYLYSPAFAQVIRPLAELPFVWFAVVLVAVDVACAAWLLAPLGWRWAIPILLLLPEEFLLGNISGILALAAVLAMTGRPGAWSLGWLTKITPGALGFVWHAARGTWVEVATGAAWTAAIVIVSFLAWPSAWFEWFAFLQTSSSGAGWVAVRLAAAVVLVVVGGRRNWPYCVPIALVISAPMVGVKNLTFLAALVRLRPDAGARPYDDATAVSPSVVVDRA
jgi:hypothetical protein